MDAIILVWLGFFALVATLLALDLGVFHRKSHEIKMREAIGWTVFWIAVGLSFTAVVYFLYPEAKPAAPTPDNPEMYDRWEAIAAYLGGYIMEKMLSVDNLFIFVILFSFFGVKAKDQHHVLFWGILGALVMRGLFIFIGVAAIEKWEWILFFFGGLLIYSAARMAYTGDAEFNPAESRTYRFLRRILPFSDKPHEGKFFIRGNGRRMGTCLLLCLFMVEMTDILFAIDSVPAVIGIARDRFIIYTSNVFAILGLRSLYFVIAGGLQSFKYLKPGLVLILGFIGAKMILGGPSIPLIEQMGGPHFPLIEISVYASLSVVIIILGVAVAASAVSARRARRKKHARPPPPRDKEKSETCAGEHRPGEGKKV
ncbi:MAG: TerC/Alx family metal homeostasis membrane protein [Euryarchaeota archaeon]|nr:TerC/Alx family metal homeostasis membrane protein [Euryarchaeota archaeon]